MYQQFERKKIYYDSAVCYQWLETESNACILFIHGLGGSALETWGNLPNLIMGTKFSRHVDVISYDYNSSKYKINSPSIETITGDLITFCESFIGQYERVYIISHSLGSVLTLNIIPKLNEINSRWSNKIRGHILLAPALWGSIWGWISPSKTARELKYGSVYLKEILNKWVNYKNNQSIQSFIVFGSSDRVIKKNLSEIEELGIIPKNTARNHFSISKINDIDEVTYLTIMNCLYELDDSDHYDSRSYLKRKVFDSIKSDWEYDDELSEFVYVPDFKLRILEFTKRGKGRPFTESWTKNFSDPNASQHNYAIYYINLRIHDFSMIFCDGFRYLIPLPEKPTKLSISQEQYVLGKIMEKAGMYDDLDQGLRMSGIQVK